MGLFPFIDGSIEERRICVRCNFEKPLVEFVRARPGHGRGGRKTYCKKCNNASIKQWVADNQQRAYDISRRARVKKRFGISVERYDEIVAFQGGVCAVCRKPETFRHPRSKASGPDRLGVDHCHASGVIRGLLCRRCNGALGEMETFDGGFSAAVSALAAYLASGNMWGVMSPEQQVAARKRRRGETNGRGKSWRGATGGA